MDKTIVDIRSLYTVYRNRLGVQGLPAFGGAEGDQGSEVQD